MQALARTAVPVPVYKRHVLTVDSRNRENPDLTTPLQVQSHVSTLAQRGHGPTVLHRDTQLRVRASLTQQHDLSVDGSSNIDVTLSPGTYTSTEMANEINKQLNAVMNAPFGSIFQVTAMTMTSKLRIDRVDGRPFQLKFAGKSNTAALVLGFDPATDAPMYTDSTSGNTYTKSVNIINMAGENYVYLCLKGMQTMTTSEHIHDVFAKIIYKVPPRAIAFDTFVSNPCIYNEPMMSMQQLEVSFVRHDGYLVDFNTINHSFTLEFFCQ